MASIATAKATASKTTRARAGAAKAAADLSGDSGESGDHKHRRTHDERAAEDGDDDSMDPPQASTDDRLDALTAMLTARFASDDRKETQFLGILDTWTTRFDSFEAKFAASDRRAAKVDDQLSRLQARFEASELRDRAGPAGLASSGTASSSAGGFRPPSRSSPAAASEETLVFFDRAKYDLHRLVLGRYWNDTVKKLVPRALTAISSPHIGNRDTFAIAFPSETAAKAFLSALDEKGGAPDLIDNDGVTHELEARLQRNKVPTKFGKQLSPVFQYYLNLLQTRADFKNKKFTLHADAHRGRIYIEKGEHIVLLHTLNLDGASLRSHEERLDEFGLIFSECQTAAKLFAAA
jgi:hypothetical protein